MLVGSNKGIKLDLSDEEMMDTTLVGTYGIKLWGDEGSDMVYSDGPFILGPAQDIHFFYTRSHLSALKSYALILSTNFLFNFAFN